MRDDLMPESLTLIIPAAPPQIGRSTTGMGGTASLGHQALAEFALTLAVFGFVGRAIAIY